jgi:secondary thiamine-phosphate synthase enzyme
MPPHHAAARSGGKEGAMILDVRTGSRTQLVDITADIQKIVSDSGIRRGWCMIYVPHTTAAVTINESADPSVRQDIVMVLNQIVPWKADYKHLEGNSPAHVKASLMGASELIAVEGGQLVLGTWQGIFFCEFDGPRSRKVHVRWMHQQT